jgi:hypothetical protein
MNREVGGSEDRMVDKQRNGWLSREMSYLGKCEGWLSEEMGDIREMGG